MVRVITQETFEDVVKENMEEFDMEYAEAVRYTMYSTLLFRIGIRISRILPTDISYSFRFTYPPENTKENIFIL